MSWQVPHPSPAPGVAKWTGILAACIAAGTLCGARTTPATFHVDGETGDDAAAGTAESAAWRTLEKVNAAELIPGDRVLFRRGGLWRGQLVPQSGSNGAPIVYGAYGSGAKPILQGSMSRSRPGDWIETAPGVWATRKSEPQILQQVADLAGSPWSIHQEGGAKVKLTREQEDGRGFVRIACTAAGKAGNHIQLWGPALTNAPATFVLRIRARSTIPFPLGRVAAILNRPPYTTAFASATGRKEIVAAWQTIDIPVIEIKKLDAPPHLHINLGDTLPAGAVLDLDPVGLWAAHIDTEAALPRDVGIVILDHGAKWGVKKWALADVRAPLDYWYDEDGKRVFLACDANPATRFASVELALTRHIVNQGGCHDVVYDGLAVRYGAAHGFGGGSTARIVIRNCDVCWIGGGLQYWKKRDNGTTYPVRFGNGIEFWGDCDNNLVERNRLWQIYDAALTNQGRDDDETNITYRDNVIWQAEYSFEYWNAKRTANILFEHNTCVDAGFCWSHDQRPNPNGAHLMFYRNPAATTNFVIRNNIFARSTEVCTRMENDWRVGLTMRNNLYHQPEKPFLRWLSTNHFAAADFARYRAELGLDQGSLVAEPQFVDPAARDYRLKPGSPGTSLATDGGPVGARW
jgi:hypothetical protein